MILANDKHGDDKDSCDDKHGDSRDDDLEVGVVAAAVRLSSDNSFPVVWQGCVLLRINNLMCGITGAERLLSHTVVKCK